MISDKRQATNDRRGDQPASLRFFSCRVCLVACACLLTMGCVHRALTIQTTPPGASIYVNDELKGNSPLTYDFLWYGTYHVVLQKEGFERIDDRKPLNAPVHLWIPFDLIMELLPFPMRDARTWSYTLIPQPALPTPAPPPLISRKEVERQTPATSAEIPSSENAPGIGETTVPAANTPAAPPSAPAQPATETTNDSR